MITFKPHQALEFIAPYITSSEPVIVEAGAFTGQDTIKMAKYWPQGIVYAFEPVPEIYEQLKSAVAPYTNIYTYQCALSTKVGTALLYLAEKNDKQGRITQASSLYPPKERLTISPIQFSRTITVLTDTIDSWALKQEISHIDVLWLDVQGYEYAVLKASPNMLSTVSVIYTEVAFIEAYAGQPSMQTMIDFLLAHNFEIIGRDFSETSSRFFGNLLCVKKR